MATDLGEDGRSYPKQKDEVQQEVIPNEVVFEYVSSLWDHLASWPKTKMKFLCDNDRRNYEEVVEVWKQCNTDLRRIEQLLGSLGNEVTKSNASGSLSKYIELSYLKNLNEIQPITSELQTDKHSGLKQEIPPVIPPKDPSLTSEDQKDNAQNSLKREMSSEFHDQTYKDQPEFPFLCRSKNPREDRPSDLCEFQPEDPSTGEAEVAYEITVESESEGPCKGVLEVSSEGEAEVAYEITVESEPEGPCKGVLEVSSEGEAEVAYEMTVESQPENLYKGKPEDPREVHTEDLYEYGSCEITNRPKDMPKVMKVKIVERNNTILAVMALSLEESQRMVSLANLPPRVQDAIHEIERKIPYELDVVFSSCIQPWTFHKIITSFKPHIVEIVNEFKRYMIDGRILVAVEHATLASEKQPQNPGEQNYAGRDQPNAAGAREVSSLEPGTENTHERSVSLWLYEFGRFVQTKLNEMCDSQRFYAETLIAQTAMGAGMGKFLINTDLNIAQKDTYRQWYNRSHGDLAEILDFYKTRETPNAEESEVPLKRRRTSRTQFSNEVGNLFSWLKVVTKMNDRHQVEEFGHYIERKLIFEAEIAQRKIAEVVIQDIILYALEGKMQEGTFIRYTPTDELQRTHCSWDPTSVTEITTDLLPFPVWVARPYPVCQKRSRQPPPTSEDTPPLPPPSGQSPSPSGQSPPPSGQSPPPSGQIPAPAGQRPPPSGQSPSAPETPGRLPRPSTWVSQRYSIQHPLCPPVGSPPPWVPTPYPVGLDHSGPWAPPPSPVAQGTPPKLTPAHQGPPPQPTSANQGPPPAHRGHPPSRICLNPPHL